METVVNIVSYIEGLERDTRDMLYGSPWTCQALFRSLPPLAKQYILRLLWVHDRAVAKGKLEPCDLLAPLLFHGLLCPALHDVIVYGVMFHNAYRGVKWEDLLCCDEPASPHAMHHSMSPSPPPAHSMKLPMSCTADVDGWINPDKPEWGGQHRGAIDKLELLGILQSPASKWVVVVGHVPLCCIA